MHPSCRSSPCCSRCGLEFYQPGRKIIQDLFFMNEGNDDKVEFLINFDKLRQISNHVLVRHHNTHPSCHLITQHSSHLSSNHTTLISVVIQSHNAHPSCHSITQHSSQLPFNHTTLVSVVIQSQAMTRRNAQEYEAAPDKVTFTHSACILLPACMPHHPSASLQLACIPHHPTPHPHPSLTATQGIQAYLQVACVKRGV